MLFFSPLLYSGAKVKGLWQLNHSLSAGRWCLDVAGERDRPMWEPWSSWESQGSCVSAQMISPLSLQCCSVSWVKGG